MCSLDPQYRGGRPSSHQSRSVAWPKPSLAARQLAAKSTVKIPAYLVPCRGKVAPDWLSALHFGEPCAAAVHDSGRLELVGFEDAEHLAYPSGLGLTIDPDKIPTAEGTTPLDDWEAMEDAF